MKTNAAPRNLRRKEARPQEILQAALQLFVEKGFAAAKMEDIARAAGVTRGTPYLYFANKEDIFKSLITELLLPQLALGESILSEHQGNTRDLLTDLLATWWAQMSDNHASVMPRLVLAEAGHFPEVARLYKEVFVERGLQIIRQVLQRGLDKGDIRNIDIDMACHIVVAPLMMFMITCHSAVPKCAYVDDPQRYFDSVIDILLNGICQTGAHHE